VNEPINGENGIKILMETKKEIKEWGKYFSLYLF
jgi:hypothetical protein